MADTKISSLPLVSSLTGAELVPIVQGGATQAATTAQIATLAPATGVAPGNYTNANITVNAKGQVTAASNGAGGSGGITALTGDVTASGVGSAAATLANTAVTPGSYTNANITVDAKGRVISASNGTSSSGGITSITGDGTAGSNGVLTVTKINGQSPATVATTGSYNDLVNKPTLGTAAALAAGSANGVATLGSDGKVPSAQLPATSNAVTSVAGKTGAVTLTASDVSGLATVATSGLFGDLTGPANILLGPAISSTLAGSASGYALNADGSVSTIANAPVGIHLRRSMELRSSAIRGRKQFASVNRVRARNGYARMLVITDSTGVGGNTSGVRWPDQLANQLQGNLTANSNAKFGFDSTVVESRESITGCTRDATMLSLGGSSLKMATAGDKLSITPDTVTDRCRIWYIQNTGAGTFNGAYNFAGGVDLGSVVGNTAGTPGIGSVVISGSPGLVTYTATWASGTLNIIGYECWNSTLASFEILNSALGGSSTSNWSNTTNPWSWQNAAVAIGADIYWIGTGINDTAGTTALATYESRLTGMYTAFSGATSLLTGATGADVIIATGLAQNPDDNVTNHHDSISKQETYVNSTRKVAYNNNCLLVDMYAGLGLYAERKIADPSTDDWVHGGTITYTCMASLAYMALVGDIGSGYGYTGSVTASTNYAKFYHKAIDTHRLLLWGNQVLGRGVANSSMIAGIGTQHQSTAPNNTIFGDNNFNATSASDANVVVGRGSFTRSVFGSNNLILGSAVASNASTGLTGGSTNFLVGMDQTVTTPTTTTSNYWNLYNSLVGTHIGGSTSSVAAGFAALGMRSLIGALKGANFNVTTDQAITIRTPGGVKYLVTDIIVTNASIALTTAQGGIYTAASKGGAALVAATQAYTNATGTTGSGTSAVSGTQQATLAAAAQNNTYAATTLYLSLTTAQGAAATGDVYVFGIPLA